MATNGPGEREAAIDALRGACLLGIAIVNAPWIGAGASLPLQLGLHFEGRQLLALPDLISAIGVEWLCEGKFYPQFAALFGFGAGVLMARGVGIYARRIAVLFVLGILHSIFGWWGDILLNYAVLGVLLALFWKAPPRALLAVAIASYVAATGVSFVFDHWFDPVGDQLTESLEHVAEETAIYGRGTFWAITQYRTDEMLRFFSQYNWSYRLDTVAMGFFGLFVARSGFLSDLKARRRQLGFVALGCLAVGLPGAAVPQLYIPAGDVLAMGYASFFLWLAARGSIDAVVKLLTPIGRMAITCYLGQTLAFTLFFYSYGLGLYGELSAWQCLALSVSVWTIEVLFARAWLSRFTLGPVEWLWRSITYRRVLPMQR
jgi:uncharacterized protein